MTEYTPTINDLREAYHRATFDSIGTNARINFGAFDRAIAAHDAGVRADQSEKAAVFTRKWFRTEMLEGGGYWGDRFALELAVALTPITEETEQ